MNNILETKKKARIQSSVIEVASGLHGVFVITD